MAQRDKLAAEEQAAFERRKEAKKADANAQFSGGLCEPRHLRAAFRLRSESSDEGATLAMAASTNRVARQPSQEQEADSDVGELAEGEFVAERIADTRIRDGGRQYLFVSLRPSVVSFRFLAFYCCLFLCSSSCIAHALSIKWRGFPDAQCTWEPESSLANCQLLIAQFRAGRQMAPRDDAPVYPSGERVAEELPFLFMLTSADSHAPDTHVALSTW